MAQTTELTLKQLVDDVVKIYKPESTFEEFKKQQTFLITEKELVIKALTDCTKDELKRFCSYSARTANKSEMVTSVYDNLLGQFLMAKNVSYNPMAEKYADARQRIFDAQTEEEFLAYKEQREKDRAAKEKAITNPETLEEFNTYLMYKDIKTLSPEKRELYDSLRADRLKSYEQEKPVKEKTAQAVDTNVPMELKESVHTKKNIPLWVVVMGERVPKEVYYELNSRAKALGGYYSSYTKDGAIAGFTFTEKEKAEAFMNVDQTEKVTVEKPDTTESRYDILKQKAQKIIEAGEAELNKDRQTNTHRRANMAANAEAKAMAQVKFGKTLDLIAEGLKAGSIKYLDKINASTELETLMSILYTARHRHLNKLNLSHSERQEFKETSETVEYATVPYPCLYKEHCKTDLEILAGKAGTQLAAKRLLKMLAVTPMDHVYCKSESDISDYRKCFAGTQYGSDKWRFERYKSALTTYDRVKRLGLTNDILLRAALRELIMIKNGAIISPEVERQQKLRALERKFIGAQIQGFFPTPDELADYVVDLAGIQDGDIVLEPNGGLGHIAEVIRQRHPENMLYVVEYVHSLCEVLEEKGFAVTNGDFLQHTVEESGKYDKIVMNPPFENLQDIDHVLHAYSLLKDGGRLVAIMAAKDERSSRQKVQDFMQFVGEHGWYEVNPEGSFKSAFRPIGVSTITVVLNK